MADLYRSKVEELAAALQREDTRLEASEMLRGLIDSIVLTRRGGQLRIELQRESGRDVDCRPENEKVARNRRPSRADTIGCGGTQPTGFGVSVDRGRTGIPHASITTPDAALVHGSRASVRSTASPVAAWQACRGPWHDGTSTIGSKRTGYGAISTTAATSSVSRWQSGARAIQAASPRFAENDSGHHDLDDGRRTTPQRTGHTASEQAAVLVVVEPAHLLCISARIWEKKGRRVRGGYGVLAGIVANRRCRPSWRWSRPSWQHCAALKSPLWYCAKDHP